jgi:hypothetical protein
MSKRYYVLVERASASAHWGVAFGAYDRSDVDAERRDMRDHGVRAADLQILIAPTGRQTDVDAVVAALAAGEG